MENTQLNLSRQLVLGELLARWTRKNPDKEILVSGGNRYTFRSFNERVNQLANTLSSLGVQKTDKIALLFLNTHELLECYFAAAKLGAVSVPLNFRLAGPELQYQIHNSDSKVCIFSTGFAKVIEAIKPELPKVTRFISAGDKSIAWAEDFEALIFREKTDEPDIFVSDDDPAFIMYTSGTTGKPKGAVMSHKNIMMDTLNLVVELGLKETDKYLCVPPLFHTAALAMAVTCLFVGAEIFLAHEFVPVKVLETIDRENISAIFLVPAMWIFLLQVPDIELYNREHLRIGVTGAAVMPVDVKKRVMEKFPNSGIFDVFGQTEMSPCTTTLKPEDAFDKPGSVGKPIINVDVRVVDDSGNDVPCGAIGEIVYKGPTTMLAYYKNPKATQEAFNGGWFHSGDLVKQDADGFIYVVDRAKDMIISGGENIYSAEVEEVLFAHEKVLEASVVGVPDKEWGESVKAVVVPVEGVPLTREELLEHCRKNLAGYKKPKHIEFVQALPRNAAGKVLKFKLR